MSVYKAIRSCIQSLAKPRAVRRRGPRRVNRCRVRLRRPSGETGLHCQEGRDQADLRPREPGTLPEQADPWRFRSSSRKLREAIPVLDTDDTPVGWVADANC